MPLVFEDDEAVFSILEFLGYVKNTTLIRQRSVFEKGAVKFEFDVYEQPRKTCVVAVEGDRKEVDAVYEELKNLIQR